MGKKRLKKIKGSYFSMSETNRVFPEEFLNNKIPKSESPDDACEHKLFAPYNYGWVLYAKNVNATATPISLFQVFMTVPDYPEDDNLQKLFIFPALHDAANTKMIQCVLQYGLAESGRGQYWSVACWQVVKAGRATRVTPAVRVKPGQLFTAEIRYLTSGYPPFTYQSSFKNLIPEVFISAPLGNLQVCSLVLEPQGVLARSNYPPEPESYLSQIRLQAGGHDIPFQWTNAS